MCVCGCGCVRVCECDQETEKETARKQTEMLQTAPPSHYCFMWAQTQNNRMEILLTWPIFLFGWVGSGAVCCAWLCK